MVVGAQIGPADIAELCRRTRALLEEADAQVVTCDVGAVDPDIATLDVLARLKLVAGRFGASLRVVNAGVGVHLLVALAGLDEVIRLEDRSGLEPQRQPEHREQAGGIQKEVQPDNPPV